MRLHTAYYIQCYACTRTYRLSNIHTTNTSGSKFVQGISIEAYVASAEPGSEHK